MKTTDLFKNNRSSKKINESLQKIFGRKLNLENFDLEQLQDARNKLRTQVSQVRGESGFNENLENEAFTEAQWMLDAINAEIAEREEHIVNTTVSEEVDPNDVVELSQQLQQGEISYDEFLEKLERLEYTDHSMRQGERGMHGDDTMAGHRSWDRDRAEWDRYDSEEEDEYDDYYDQDDEDEPKENFGPLAARREKSSNSRIYDLYMDGMSAEEIGRRLRIDDTGMIQDVIDQIEANGGEPIGEASDNLADLFMQMAKDQGLSLSQRGTPDEERAKRDDMIKQRDADRANEPKRLPPTPEERARLEAELKKLKAEFDPNYQYSDDHNFWSRQNSLHKNIISIKQRLSQTDESVAMEKAPPGGKYERMVKHIKKGYAKDGKLSDKEKSIAYATAWKQKNKDTNESVNTGDNMTRRITEGEIQQAQSIVTAKTMVDRVGRWIEELSGMENDTLLQLGDQIRDEMSADQAKTFISTVAPAIQQALEALKGTRETLATGVRTLTGEEQGAEMLGAEPAASAEAPAEPEMGPAEPDAMNAGGAPEDEFGAADAAAGGLETAGRMKRESIERSNRLLKVLAG